MMSAAPDRAVQSGVADQYPILDVRDVGRSVKLPTKEVLTLLQGLNLQLWAGQSMAIMGPSGSGKTTLLRALGLFNKFDTGEHQFMGLDVQKMRDGTASKLRAQSIGFVFQEFRLINTLNARKNVEYACLLAGLGKRERKRRAIEALEQVGLGGRLRSKPKHLSGGEKQRVSIARALVKNPALVLADEPTGALDRETADAVLDLLLDTVRQRGAGLIMVTHDEAMASRCDVVVDLVRGQLVPRTAAATALIGGAAR